MASNPSCAAAAPGGSCRTSCRMGRRRLRPAAPGAKMAPGAACTRNAATRSARAWGAIPSPRRPSSRPRRCSRRKQGGAWLRWREEAQWAPASFPRGDAGSPRAWPRPSRQSEGGGHGALALGGRLRDLRALAARLGGPGVSRPAASRRGGSRGRLAPGERRATPALGLVSHGREPPPMPAFTVWPRRWVVERTIAWVGRSRRLSTEDEYLPESRETLIYLAMSRLMLRRLARQAPAGVPSPQRQGRRGLARAF